ncbi:MAG: CopD family protein [Chromatiales bacterium]|nr:CopD family protein [Chromatiales bacterium]
MTTFSLLMTLHIVATIVWVGGMFFAHMALRPAVNDLLEPPVRLPLMHRVLSGFFPWVWVAIALLLITGYWVFLGIWGGKAGLHVHSMMGIGLVMMGIFAYIYFVPFRRMGKALNDQDIPVAGQQMAKIRALIGVNLVLGLITSVVATAKLF